MRFHSLNSLRGIAAFIVVLNHAFISIAFEFFTTNEAFQNTPIYNLFNARLAVLFFFILSGFVLSLAYISGNNLRYRAYILRRFCRIYIPFMVITLFTVGLYYVITKNFAEPHIEWSLWNKALTIDIIVQHFLMTNKTVMLNPPLWTLMIEMKVVMIFPLLAYLVIKNPILTLVTSCMISYISALAFVSIDEYDNFYTSSSHVGSILMLVYYIQFFVLGIFLAVKKDAIIKSLGVIPGAIHSIIIIFLFSIPYAQIKHDFLLLEIGYGLFTAYVIMLAIKYEAFERVLVSKPIEWLGRVSYSLYLIHVPILWSGFYLLNGLVSTPYILIVTLVITLILSEIVYRTIEKPSQCFGKRFN